MDEKTFKKRLAKLDQVGKALEKLPPEIRAAAFAILESYVIETEDDAKQGEHDKEKKKPKKEPKNMEEFFGSRTLEKPADNVKLIAAYLYNEYGSDPFSIEEVKAIADEVGITIPGRIDMTLSAAKDKGKKLFAKAGKGKFKPTVNGEVYLKTQYEVKKGTKRRQEETK